MHKITINITKLGNAQDLPLPQYATIHSAGVDLVAAIDGDLIIEPNQRILIPTGIAISIPEGFEGQVRPRSGLAIKNGITVINAPGTIDSDYRGEIKVPIINLGDKDFIVERGMRIAQLIIARYEKIEWNLVEQLPQNTTRGDAGFGSTGLVSK
ncbi:dUTP diphosphatase [Candidatus Bandiella numerosa]|jgi:dUTP pyrophosphatase|nr:dUTP diphosphatase [Candidatus Bandiella numerosa]WHA05400.1 dUTP diphosphatase [Candidatus Bandiella numerosa]